MTMKQTTLEKFFGLRTSSASSSSRSDEDVEVISVEAPIQKSERKLPQSLISPPSNASKTVGLKRQCRFANLEELEASYDEPQASKRNAKLAPVFLRAKREKVEEIISTSNQEASLESILADCFVRPIESLPEPPPFSATRQNSFQTSKVPFSHQVPGTCFVVDYFEEKNAPVFLSHFHCDHYRGLTNSSQNQIYCSDDTARLVLQNFTKLGKKVVGLPLEKWSLVDGVHVLLLEAFHCPGTVCFVFRTASDKFCFHSGDFRAGLFVQRYAEALKKLCHLSSAFVDTTYCDPVYDFPSQHSVIKAILDACFQGNNPIISDKRCLVVVGTYTIGKECVFAALGRLLNSPICVSAAKLKLIKCFLSTNSETYANRLLAPCTLTTQPVGGARVHVLPMQTVSAKCLPGYLSKYKHLFDKLVAFSPTGWTTQRGSLMRRRIITDKITLFEVPYSEHSAFSELKCFVEALLKSPVNVYPSVFSNYEERRRIEEQLKDWIIP